MKQLYTVLLAATSGLLFSCGPTMVDLAIDNPSEVSIVVSVDTLVVEVPPREVVWVEMGQGEHRITLPNDSVVTYNFTEKMYMLNPTLTQYLKYEQFYGNEFAKNSHVSAIPFDTVYFYGLELAGNFGVVKDLVNAISWDFGPREELPQMIEMDEDETYAAMIKLADPIELEKELSSGSGDESSYEEGSYEEQIPPVDEVQSVGEPAQ